jgi:aryl carrier-like protein
VARGAEPLASEVAPSAARPRPQLATEYAEPQGELQRALARLAQGLLGVDRVGRHDNLFELGFDSLLAQRMIRRIKEHLRIGITVGTLLKNATLAELAEFLEAKRLAASMQEIEK